MLLLLYKKAAKELLLFIKVLPPHCMALLTEATEGTSPGGFCGTCQFLYLLLVPSALQRAESILEGRFAQPLLSFLSPSELLQHVATAGMKQKNPSKANGVKVS